MVIPRLTMGTEPGLQAVWRPLRYTDGGQQPRRDGSSGFLAPSRRASQPTSPPQSNSACILWRRRPFIMMPFDRILIRILRCRWKNSEVGPSQPPVCNTYPTFGSNIPQNEHNMNTISPHSCTRHTINYWRSKFCFVSIYMSYLLKNRPPYLDSHIFLLTSPIDPHYIPCYPMISQAADVMKMA